MVRLYRYIRDCFLIDEINPGSIKQSEIHFICLYRNNLKSSLRQQVLCFPWLEESMNGFYFFQIPIFFDWLLERYCVFKLPADDSFVGVVSCWFSQALNQYFVTFAATVAAPSSLVFAHIHSYERGSWERNEKKEKYENLSNVSPSCCTCSKRYSKCIFLGGNKLRLNAYSDSNFL